MQEIITAYNRAVLDSDAVTADIVLCNALRTLSFCSTEDIVQQYNKRMLYFKHSNHRSTAFYDVANMYFFNDCIVIEKESSIMLIHFYKGMFVLKSVLRKDNRYYIQKWSHSRLYH